MKGLAIADCSLCPDCLYPERWYERVSRPTLLAVSLVVGLPLFYHQYFLFLKVGWLALPPTWASVLMVLVYLSGIGFDLYTTWECVRLKPEFDLLGEEFIIEETNIFLPKHPTTKELLTDWKSFLINLLFLPVVYFIPGFAIGDATRKAIVILKNHRLAIREGYYLKLMKKSEAKGKETPVSG